MSRSRVLPLLLAFLLSAALLLRLWSLNDAPPWLWWDEASQGLDARDLIEGHFRVFFTRAEGKEPLYVYLTVPFIAAFDGAPFAVRLAGALSGVGMIPALFAAGRALWREQPTAGAWAGVLAAAFWTTNFWPQSINRIGFQVNTLPLILTLGVVAWLNWIHRPVRSRALYFGFLAGLVLYTYLAARITPLLWLALFATLPAAQRKALRPTVKWALLAFALAATPLLLHLALHPEEAIRRVGGFTAFYEAPDTGDRATLLLDSFVQVAGGFLGFAGDPIPRHNIPNRPPFSLPLALLFAAGLLLALPGLVRRSSRSWTLLLWLGILAFPAFLSANSNPHFPRLLGALPAAFLIAAGPVAWLRQQLDAPTQFSGFRRLWRPLSTAALLAFAFALLIALEAARNIPAYFIAWARDPVLYSWFQGDLWRMADRIQQPPREFGVVPLDPSSAYTLDYAFAGAPIVHTQVAPTTLESWLQQTLAPLAGKLVSTSIWEVEPYIYADTQHAIPFYLAREGILTDENHETGYILQDYRLGEQPQFTTSGQETTVQSRFGPDLTLVEARWGAAHPNVDRGTAEVAAGTPLWVILEWQLDAPIRDIRTAVDLVDTARHRLATTEQPLLQADGLLLHLPPDGMVRTYHLVTAPAAQPPGQVNIEVRAYNAASGEVLMPDSAIADTSVLLGAAEVTQPIQPPADGVVIPVPVPSRLGTGIRLLGHDGWPDQVAPGQDVTFRIYWQADTTLDVALPVTITVNSEPVASVTLPAVPTGQPIQTFIDMQAPADLVSGKYAIALIAPGASEHPVRLGDLSVAGRSVTYDAPALSQSAGGRFDDVVALAGVADTPGLIHAKPGESVALTLVWRPLATTDRKLVRFVHALGADRRPVAQNDSTPCAGECPSQTWRSGEILLETIHLEIPPEAPSGDYPLAVGWFDSTTGERLTGYDGENAPTADRLLELPITLRIDSTETAP